MSRTVAIHGGALAGAAAAIAAKQSGATEVCVYEKSRFPRHKVCGEFLSSGVQRILKDLDLWEEFQSLGPAPMRRLLLHFPRKSFCFPLPEVCWGMSRYTLDVWLMQAAERAGAVWRQEVSPASEGLVVLAHGRKETAPKGNRQFGFKAHHAGTESDAIELFFFDGGYVGVNPAENGITNVCGLGPESLLNRHGFDYDSLCQSFPPLAARLKGLDRQMRWHSVGPLVYGNRFGESMAEGVYPAGDALGFVDPFTGTGMFNALLSGSLAGRAAASGQPVASYLRDCKRLLHRPFLISSLFRAALSSGAGERFAGWVPGSLLFRMTRAHLGESG